MWVGQCDEGISSNSFQTLLSDGADGVAMRARNFAQGTARQKSPEMSLTLSNPRFLSASRLFVMFRAFSAGPWRKAWSVLRSGARR